MPKPFRVSSVNVGRCAYQYSNTRHYGLNKDLLICYLFFSLGARVLVWMVLESQLTVCLLQLTICGIGIYSQDVWGDGGEREWGKERGAGRERKRVEEGLKKREREERERGRREGDRKKKEVWGGGVRKIRTSVESTPRCANKNPTIKLCLLHHLPCQYYSSKFVQVSAFVCLTCSATSRG